MRRWWRFLVFTAFVVVCIVGLWLVNRDTTEQKVDAEVDEAQAEAQADAALNSLDALCDAGNRAACKAIKSIGEVNDADPNDPEFQEPEVQEPEIQEQERQEREQQEREIQEADENDPDLNDPEAQEDEVQDGEIDDPDPDDPENQDPEVDDPDPNSELTFAIRDECENAFAMASQVVYTWEKTPTTVTLVITC